MPRPSFNALETLGLDVLTGLGLPVVGNLSDVLIRDVNPDGDYGRDEHFEIDYLIPHGELCLVGEITERNAAHADQKFTRFRRTLNVLRGLNLDDAGWQTLGVPRQRVREFRRVTEFRGFFIATNVEEFDQRLGGRHSPNIAVFYRPDWRLLNSYANALGSYGGPHVRAKLGIPAARGMRALSITREDHSLIVAHDRRVATGAVGPADVFTFEVWPYDLLPLAQVYRRDQLPDLSPRAGKNYQRPLILDKLRRIRKKLLATGDFVFPSNILLILSSDCRYDRRHKTLTIPGRYGAIEVIDGQHRLFSYADERIEQQRGADARIMATAIQFSDTDEGRVRRHSAKTFVEINTNQTRIAASHLDAIAFDVLGDTAPGALAAAAVIRLNDRDSPTVRGIFKTSQTSLGIISSATVARAMRPLMSVDSIRDLAQDRSPAATRRLAGYRHLFGGSPEQLRRASTMLERGVAAFEQYFNRLQRVFRHDWPSRDMVRASALEYAKVFAALIMLFDQFVSEGLTWTEVQRELERIRDNVLGLRRLATYDDVLFDDDADNSIPDSGPTAQDDFKFLQANRQTPTPIHGVITQRRRRRRRRGPRRR